MLGVEPDYLLYFVSQRWTPILNGAATPPVIKRCLGGPGGAVESLMYATVCTKPNIAHAVGVVSGYMNNPRKEHWMAVKWILRYLRGTTNQALCFDGSNIALQEYVDADVVGDRDNRRSTTGYVFAVGGTTISWVSKIQSVVALSTTEAEYVAATEASKEMIWLQRFMDELGKKHDMGTLYNDSQSTIHLAKNSAFHSRTKHIQLKYHFIRSVLEDRQLKLEKINTSQNPVDMLTKVVTGEKLKLCSVQLVFKYDDEDEKQPDPKWSQCPANEAAVELLQSVSKWEIVGCGA